MKGPFIIYYPGGGGGRHQKLGYTCFTITPFGGIFSYLNFQSLRELAESRCPQAPTPFQELADSGLPLKVWQNQSIPLHIYIYLLFKNFSRSMCSVVLFEWVKPFLTAPEGGGAIVFLSQYQHCWKKNLHKRETPQPMLKFGISRQRSELHFLTPRGVVGYKKFGPPVGGSKKCWQNLG